MHSHIRHLAALLLACVASANISIARAQDVAVLAPSQGTGGFSVYGLSVGQACDEAREALRQLRSRGFRDASSIAPCMGAQASFSSTILIADADDRVEQLELGFSPGGRVWLARLSTRWKAEARLFMKPSHEDLINSLQRRYGAPYAIGDTRSVEPTGDGHWTRQQEVAWQISASSNHRPSTFNQIADSWAWTRAQKNLEGTVLNATVLSGGETGEAALVLEFSDRDWTAAYRRFESDQGLAERAKEAGRSSSFLRGY